MLYKNCAFKAQDIQVAERLMAKQAVSGIFVEFGLFHKHRGPQKTAQNSKGSKSYLGESKTLLLFHLLHLNTIVV